MDMLAWLRSFQRNGTALFLISGFVRGRGDSLTFQEKSFLTLQSEDHSDNDTYCKHLF